MINECRNNSSANIGLLYKNGFMLEIYFEIEAILQDYSDLYLF